MNTSVFIYPWDLGDEGCGVEQISFYNYGLMWKCEFGWVAQSLGAGRGALA